MGGLQSPWFRRGCYIFITLYERSASTAITLSSQAVQCVSLDLMLFVSQNRTFIGTLAGAARKVMDVACCAGSSKSSKKRTLTKNTAIFRGGKMTLR